jgi:hypothetical protein
METAMKDVKPQILIALALIVAAVSLRLLPHPANFVPITAVALFGGAVLPRRLAIWVPLAAMMVTDYFIGFHDLVALTWGCYALTALAASAWLTKPSVLRGGALVIGSSLIFFLVTNFAVWATTSMYAHSLSGLAECYYMALPFFRNSLVSDVIYSGALFSLYGLATRAASSLSVRHSQI